MNIYLSTPTNRNILNICAPMLHTHTYGPKGPMCPPLGPCACYACYACIRKRSCPLASEACK